MATNYNSNNLYQKYLNKQCSPDEISLLLLFFEETESAVLTELVQKQLEKDNTYFEDHTDHTERYERIFLNLREAIGAQHKPKVFRWKAFAIAASVLIAVCTGLLFYQHNSNKVPVLAEIQPKSEIVPGGNKAFLTLMNGKRITLAESPDGIIATQAGINVLKAKGKELVYNHSGNNYNIQGQIYNTLQTPNGGQYQVVLPDGSRVWLNAASSLKFPVNFASLRERRVQMTGEAYFEVKKDASRPFIVETDDQQVQVLGTHFNVNAYHDAGGSKTTLLEGKIKATTGSAASLIKPGQQVVTDGTDKLIVKEADIQLAIAWKNDQFMFDSMPLKGLMENLARWYDVEIVYQANVPDIHFNGSVSKFENISAVLNLLESTGKVHFKLEGRKVYVNK